MRSGHEHLMRIVEREVADRRVVEAFRAVMREGFVPAGSEIEAYEDRPVLLPHRQTTSQPSLIARMVEAAEVSASDDVLEIGTGYGFQTAVLAKLGRSVVSVERYPRLAEAARRNLQRAGIENVEVVVGDGWDGWPDGAPYDAIVVSAAADEMPSALVDQLAERGRFVLPLKSRGSDDVIQFRKRDGELVRDHLITPARFVPLVRGPADA